MNFAGMPANAEGRNFTDIEGKIQGQLGTKLDLKQVLGLGLATSGSGWRWA